MISFIAYNIIVVTRIWNAALELRSPSCKASDCEISWSLEATTLDATMTVSCAIWQTRRYNPCRDTCLALRAIKQSLTHCSRLRDFTGQLR